MCRKLCELEVGRILHGFCSSELNEQKGSFVVVLSHFLYPTISMQTYRTVGGVVDVGDVRSRYVLNILVSCEAIQITRKT